VEVGDLNSDENTLLGQLDQRAIEINKLKNELASLLADNEQLLSEKMRHDQTAAGVRRDNEQIVGNIREFSSSNDTVRRKTEDLDKYLAKKKGEEALLKEKIIAYEDKNNGMDAEINATKEDLVRLEREISNAQNELSSLQNNIAETSGTADKHKVEALHYSKGTQAEVMRNNDLTKQLNQAENTLRLRNNQVAEGNNTIENISAENSKLAEMNGGLRNDI
jgi:chromosome segregation ATPase